MNKTLTFLLGLACVIYSGIIAIDNWNSEEQWRRTTSLIVFIVFTAMYLLAVYAMFAKGRRKS